GGAGQIDLCVGGGGEERFEAVIVLLGDGVELVVVTARAADRQPKEGSPHAADHLGQHFVAANGRVDVAAHLMNGAATIHPDGDQQLGPLGGGRLAGQQVACELFEDEAIIGLVGV